MTDDPKRGLLEGFIGGVGSRLRQLWRTDPATPPVELAKGDMFPRGQPADLYNIYGYDTVVQYLKLDQDLLSRYVDFEEMDEYGELSSALDIYADDCTTADQQLKRVVWATAPDRTVQEILDDLYHRTLQLDDEAWGIARGMCVAEGTLVWTSTGPKPIETVEPGEWVQAYEEGKPKLVRVKRRFDNGEKDCWTIKTRHREITVTPDHKMLVRRDGEDVWVQAKDLRLTRFPGEGRNHQIDPKRTDVLVASVAAPEPVEVPSWEALGVTLDWKTSWGNKGSPNEITLPEKIEPWFCRLMGFLWGDGWFGTMQEGSTNTAIYFSRGEYEDLNDFYDELLGRFGPPVAIQELVDDGEVQGYVSRINSVRLKQTFIELGFRNGASLKTLPSWLGKLPREYRKQFIDGFIDADGWSTQQKTWTIPAIHYEIANVDLAYALKAAIDGCGLRSGNIRIRQRKPGFKIKNKVVKTTQPTGTLTFSNHVFAESTFREERVVGIEHVGARRVFDLEVDDSVHNFVADGLVIHNCKYGNEYSELLVTDEGVKGLAYLPPATVRRIEGPKGQLFGFIQDFKGKFNFTPQDYLRLLRSRYGTGVNDAGLIDATKEESPENTPVLEDWEVVHFRLMSRQRRATYGIGVMEAVRWIFKRLVLLEDTALIYRLNRAPERRAFYVDVGDLPPREALAYVNQVRQQHRKKKFYNAKTGKLDIRYQAVSSDEDFYVPTRKGQDGSRIEVLQSPAWQAMEDIIYFQDKLWAGIKIPKAYLGKEDGIVRATLSSQDVRFARTVLRVQRALISGFHRIGRVHLAALKIPPDQVPFKVNMTVPSAIFELAQIEVMNARADLAQRMQTFVSGYWILSEIFGLDDDSIKLIIKQKREEQLTQATNDATSAQILQPPQPALPAPQPKAQPQPQPSAQRSVKKPPNNALHSSKGMPRGFNGFPTGMTEREWFGGSVRDQKAARDKIKELLANDEQLSRRLNNVQGLLGDLSNRTKPQ